MHRRVWVLAFAVLGCACKSNSPPEKASRPPESIVVAEPIAQPATAAGVVERCRAESSLADANEVPAGSANWTLSILGPKLTVDAARAMVDARDVTTIGMGGMPTDEVHRALSRDFEAMPLQGGNAIYRRRGVDGQAAASSTVFPAIRVE